MLTKVIKHSQEFEARPMPVTVQAQHTMRLSNKPPGQAIDSVCRDKFQIPQLTRSLGAGITTAYQPHTVPTVLVSFNAQMCSSVR